MIGTRFQTNQLAVAIATATVLGASAVATAQEAGVLEEVLVTASARSQAVEDIPYNISSMSGDQLEARNITDQAELLRSMSGVSVVDRGYRNSGTVNSIIIRGLNVDNGLNGDISLNAVPTVSTYVNNTPLYANFVLKDIERVEVLRGPQGTLYGSGALGGTVRYITNKPSAEGFEAKISGDFSVTDGSEGNNQNLDAMVNIPLGDSLALRASVGRIENDGVIDYVNAYQTNSYGEPLVDTGSGCEDPRTASDADVVNNGACYEEVEDADWVSIDYAKIAVKWDLNDAFSATLSYQTQSDETGARRAITLGNNNQPASSPLYFEYGEYDSGQVLLEPSERDVELTALDLEWDLGFATLTSNTSNYDHTGRGDSDNGGLWVSGGQFDPSASRDWIDSFGYSGWPRPAQRAERGYDDSALVQEFRLVSNDSESAIDWLVGAFYMDQDQHVFQNSWNPGMNEFQQSCAATSDPACAGFWPHVWYTGQTLTERDLEYSRDVSFKETAIYGEVTYNFSERFRVTGGFRWFDNESINDTILGYPLVEGWTSPQVPQSTDSDSDVLLKLNASYDISDGMMVYGTVSEGYRRGGANAVPSLANGDNFGEPNAEAIRSYDKDSVINYEAGLKGRTDTMSYTVSAFYVDWDQPQLNTTTAWYGFYVAMNGEAASTTGIEAEVEGYLTDTMRYHIGYTYVQAELDEDFNSTQTGALVAPAGSVLPSSPDSVVSLSLEDSWALSPGLDLVARVNAYGQSESENFINADSALNQTHDSFFLLGASASLVSDSWTVTLYGKNLSNEQGVTGAFPEAHWSYDTGVFENWYGNGNRQFITQPRTLGVSANYSF
ncbi:TonB-dependent receptor [Umboniibacter marinipuniceus]|uniref:Outer membrane receptor protein involved in Fe transport n=1 Tax=Umboniibacter marinipuniceus TaxID=569599 RepID=A0A3M0AGY1_9GAMM|nr:TonB-dependent receptor [Umboniibacter marinipuniceus]RMA78472.1 outer membrane receptor protein involved in Fe transport [Umboniibacter marinipuniceus]